MSKKHALRWGSPLRNNFGWPKKVRGYASMPRWKERKRFCDRDSWELQFVPDSVSLLSFRKLQLKSEYVCPKHQSAKFLRNSFIYSNSQLKAELTVCRTLCPEPEPDAFFRIRQYDTDTFCQPVIAEETFWHENFQIGTSAFCSGNILLFSSVKSRSLPLGLHPLWIWFPCWWQASLDVLWCRKQVPDKYLFWMQ